MKKIECSISRSNNELIVKVPYSTRFIAEAHKIPSCEWLDENLWTFNDAFVIEVKMLCKKYYDDWDGKITEDVTTQNTVDDRADYLNRIDCFTGVSD